MVRGSWVTYGSGSWVDPWAKIRGSPWVWVSVVTHTDPWVCGSDTNNLRRAFFFQPFSKTAKKNPFLATFWPVVSEVMYLWAACV